MLSDVTSKTPDLSRTQLLSREAGQFLSRRIWLPKSLYRVLPAFYLLAGIAALFATIYISAWFWVLPHYLLFSAACVHLGVVIFRRRRNP